MQSHFLIIGSEKQKHLFLIYFLFVTRDGTWWKDGMSMDYDVLCIWIFSVPIVGYFERDG